MVAVPLAAVVLSAAFFTVTVIDELVPTVPLNAGASNVDAAAVFTVGRTAVIQVFVAASSI